jgi:anti-anti-sigma factor
MTAVRPRAQRIGDNFALGLTFTRECALVELIGEIDVIAVDGLRKLMDSLHNLDLTIHVDMSAVSFIDSTGLTPIVEACQRRRQAQLSALEIGPCSPSARLLLDVSGLAGTPHLDLQAWDQFWREHHRSGDPAPSSRRQSVW